MVTAPLCPQVNHVAVRLLAWGLTDRHVEKAVQSAQSGPSRADWNFVEVERSTEDACPIDPCDPRVIAADARNGWAYAVYAAASDG